MFRTLLTLRPSKPFVAISAVGTFIGATLIIKEFIGGKPYYDKSSIDGKNIIITGANTGIGRALVFEFAKRDATVIMACRDIEKCKKARKQIALSTRNKKIYCHKCDLASLSSVRSFVENINKSYEKIDILVNNAAVMRCPKSLTEDGFEMQLGVNHFGHFLLTNLLLNLLKKGAPSRIINVSSVAHTKVDSMNFSDLNSDKNYDPAMAYNQSKLANILFTKQLSHKLEGTKVDCNAVHPGIVYTELGRHMSYYNSWIASIFVKPFMILFFKSRIQGARPILYVALSPKLEGVSGKYFSENSEETEPSEAAEDEAAAARLWAISERWTKLDVS